MTISFSMKSVKAGLQYDADDAHEDTQAVIIL